MRAMLLSALALGAMTSLALAEPVALTDAQMDRVTAGSHGEPHGSGGTFEEVDLVNPLFTYEGARGGGSGARGGGGGGTTTAYFLGLPVETCSGGGGSGGQGQGGSGGTC